MYLKFLSILFYIMNSVSSSVTNQQNIQQTISIKSSPKSEVKYTKENIQKLSNELIPNPSFSNHKGQMGRVCIIGGSLQYTGATYYAAISSLKAGADLVYIICSESAVPILKSYSPEIIIIPHYLDQINSVDNIMKWMDRMHSILIGPGLGTNELVQNNVISIITKLTQKETNIPLVIDADGIRLLENNLLLLNNYKAQIYLTPNKREINLLFPNYSNNENLNLNKINSNLTLIIKGTEDVIMNKNISISCLEENSWRRCGGQGDLVAGTLTTFSHYANLKKQICPNIDWDIIAAFSACCIVRKSNLLAYNIMRRSMLVTDMIKKLPQALQNHFKDW